MISNRTYLRSVTNRHCDNVCQYVPLQTTLTLRKETVTIGICYRLRTTKSIPKYARSPGKACEHFLFRFSVTRITDERVRGAGASSEELRGDFFYDVERLNGRLTTFLDYRSEGSADRAEFDRFPRLRVVLYFVDR